MFVGLFVCLFVWMTDCPAWLNVWRWLADLVRLDYFAPIDFTANGLVWMADVRAGADADAAAAQIFDERVQAN